MVRNGHEVVAFGPEYHAPTVDALAAIGVSFVRIPMARAGLNPFEDVRTLGALLAAFRKHKPDVVLCYTMKPIIYGLLAARLTGVKQRHALITGLGYIFSDDANSPASATDPANSHLDVPRRLAGRRAGVCLQRRGRR